MNLVEWIGPVGVQLLLLTAIALAAYLIGPVRGPGYTMVAQVLLQRLVAWWRSRYRSGGVIRTGLPPLRYWPHDEASGSEYARETGAGTYGGFHVEPTAKPGEPIPPLPDALLWWPGKEYGHPKPPILWLEPDAWPTCPTCGAWLVAGTGATKTCPACPLKPSNNPTTEGGTAP